MLTPDPFTGCSSTHPLYVLNTRYSLCCHAQANVFQLPVRHRQDVNNKRQVQELQSCCCARGSISMVLQGRAGAVVAGASRRRFTAAARSPPSTGQLLGILNLAASWPGLTAAMPMPVHHQAGLLPRPATGPVTLVLSPARSRLCLSEQHQLCRRSPHARDALTCTWKGCHVRLRAAPPKPGLPPPQKPSDHSGPGCRSQEGKLRTDLM